MAARLVAGGGSVEDGRWQANDWVWRGAAAGTDRTLATGVSGCARCAVQGPSYRGGPGRDRAGRVTL